jgi:lysophospholipase L1-like esterase
MGKLLKERLITFLLGLGCIILLLEAALILLGLPYHPEQRLRKNFSHSRSYTILCLGDSFTYGTGAPPDKAYPRQLEELLKQRYPRKNLKVINGGKITQNTSQLLAGLDAQLKLVKPDMVIILSGGANLWNYFGYQQYLEGKPRLPVKDWLYNIKLYKLFKLLSLNLAQKRDSPAELDLPKPHPLARIWRERHRYQEAIIWFKNFAAAKPALTPPRSDYKSALQWLKQNLIQNPGKADNYDACGRLKAGRELNEMLNSLKKTLELESGLPCETLLNLLETYAAQEPNPRLPCTAPSLKAAQTASWIAHDFNQIIAVSRANQVKIVMQNYPAGFNLGAGSKIDFNEVLKAIALKNSIPWVDNYAVFQALPHRSNYFASDGHCNALGYGIMAQNIYQKIIPLLEKSNSFTLPPLPTQQD